MIYDTAFDPDPPTGHYGTVALQTAGAVLAGVFANEGADLSAHETLERTQRQEEDFSVLAAEYETLARVAQQQRWDELLDRSGLGSRHLEQVRQSAAYGPLLAALRDAESRGLDVEGVFPKLVIARALDDAEDPAAVMHGRVDRWTEAASSKRLAASNLIAGLIPRRSASPTPTWFGPSTSGTRRCSAVRETSPCRPSNVGRYGCDCSVRCPMIQPRASGGWWPSRPSPPTGTAGTSTTTTNLSVPTERSRRSRDSAIASVPKRPSSGRSAFPRVEALAVHNLWPLPLSPVRSGPNRLRCNQAPTR